VVLIGFLADTFYVDSVTGIEGVFSHYRCMLTHGDRRYTAVQTASVAAFWRQLDGEAPKSERWRSVKHQRCNLPAGICEPRWLIDKERRS
jgi:hypothetical protein